MLQPVRTKWRKAHKGRIHGNATRASTINYGSYALKAMTNKISYLDDGDLCVLS